MDAATLSLKFSRREDRTVLRVVRQDVPWRAIRSFANSSGEALVHLHNTSGSILGGDQLRLEMLLEEGSQAQVTSVGATRIHRHRDGHPHASSATRVDVCEGALLEYLPDSVIPYANSRFRQNFEARLGEDASLICWEMFAAGRVAHGEDFGFTEYSAQSQIFAGNSPLVLERFSLSPREREPNCASRFGPFRYSVTLYICRTNPSLQWLALEDQLNTIAKELSNEGCLWGASTLIRHGVVVRGMVNQAYQGTEGLLQMWQTAKQFILGRGAVVPRKIH